MKTNRLRNIIKRTLNEKKQLLKESCTCYTQNPVSGGPALVYYTCAGQSGNATVAASCSCCCNAWLHPDDVADDDCLTTSVIPSGGGNGDPTQASHQPADRPHPHKPTGIIDRPDRDDSISIRESKEIRRLLNKDLRKNI